MRFSVPQLGDSREFEKPAIRALNFVPQPSILGSLTMKSWQTQVGTVK
jgi:hypothetical protein